MTRTTAAVAAAALALTAGTVAASAQETRDIALVANNDVDGPVAQTAVHHYQQYGHASLWNGTTPNLPDLLDEADCILFVGRDARQMRARFESRDDRALVVAQGWNRYATASIVVRQDTVDQCVGGGQ